MKVFDNILQDSSLPLKPCPFCGSDKVYFVETGQKYGVVCFGCMVSTESKNTKETAQKQWNRRA